LTGTVRKRSISAASHADNAVRVMNDAVGTDYRDRAFEELGLAIHELSIAVGLIGRGLDRWFIFVGEGP
jgi:hypothetical protein